MDRGTIRQAALAIVQQIDSSPEKVKSEWATWNLAEQVNKLLDLTAEQLDEETRAILPEKFSRSARPAVALARYVDIAIAAEQIAKLLEPVVEQETLG